MRPVSTAERRQAIQQLDATDRDRAQTLLSLRTAARAVVLLQVDTHPPDLIIACTQDEQLGYNNLYRDLYEAHDQLGKLRETFALKRDEAVKEHPDHSDADIDQRFAEDEFKINTQSVQHIQDLERRIQECYRRLLPRGLEPDPRKMRRKEQPKLQLLNFNVIGEDPVTGCPGEHPRDGASGSTVLFDQAAQARLPETRVRIEKWKESMGGFQAGTSGQRSPSCSAWSNSEDESVKPWESRSQVYPMPRIQAHRSMYEHTKGFRIHESYRP